MPPKTIAPSIEAKAFSCPHCGALADQRWFNAYADTTYHPTPIVADDDFISRVRAHDDFDDNAARDKHAEWIEQLEIDKDGLPRLRRRRLHFSADFDLPNIYVSQCYSCADITIWKYKAILYPASRYEIEPNADLPPDVRA